MATAGDMVYSMNGPHRGKAVIINNMIFEPHTGVGNRLSSKDDAIATRNALYALGFREQDIQMKENLTKDQMVNLIAVLGKDDYTGYDCFVCVILTHGYYDTYRKYDQHFVGDVVYGTDQVVYLHFLLELFQPACCPNLEGKPKIFIIQACRGGAVSDAVDTRQPAVKPKPADPPSRFLPGDQVDAGAEKYKPGKPLADNPLMLHPTTPVFQDFLIYYATQPYMLAFINEVSGAYFIKALCKQIQETAERQSNIDFIQLLTRVNHDVAYGFTSRATDETYRGLGGKKQMPRITSRLSKKLMFPIKRV